MGIVLFTSTAVWLGNALGELLPAVNDKRIRDSAFERTSIKDGFTRRRTDRVGAFGWLVIGLFAVSAVFAGFLAPYDHSAQSRSEPSAPATTIHFSGLQPIIHPRRVEDPLRRTYTEDTSLAFPVGFFVRGIHKLPASGTRTYICLGLEALRASLPGSIFWELTN